MTSTNDGKDVKCNQISGQKGKSYYIDLYKSLDNRLSGECGLRERTAAVCAAWRAVHCLCQHSAPNTHAHLLAWVQRHTAKTILQTEWQSPSSKDEHEHLEQAIDDFINECHSASQSRGSPVWEGVLQRRGEWFKQVLPNPWGHPVLKLLLEPHGRPSDQEILEWLKEERGVMFVTRLRVMAAGHCDDLAVLLAAAVMGRVRRDLPPVNDSDQTQDHEEKLSPKPDTQSPPTFKEILVSEAGFSVDVWEVLTDIEFVLLHKVGRSSQCIDLAKRTPLRNGYQLVERLQSRLETSPREKKLWKNARDVATLIAQVVIARCMVVATCSGVCRSALYCCARSLVRLLPARKLRLTAATLAAPACTARHLHTLAAAVHAECIDEMKPFVCELYIRAITAGMNELERLKVKTETEAEARAAEQTLGQWFTQLGALLAASARLRSECALTAFSLHPSPSMYARIQSAPQLSPAHIEKQEHDPEETTSEFGSWASDSRTKTNLVKTSETLNIKKLEKHSNAVSTAILTEGEALGLSPELCQDLAVLLSGPRLKTLSWDVDRDSLLEKCLAHMERTHGGTRALTTELRFLNLDPSQYLHLPEDDEDENDLYYGIEKGYEHLVDFQEPDELVGESVFDNERTETACSSEAESITVVVKRKKKLKRLVSDEEELGSPSIVDGNGTGKKERPHSKERSKNKTKKTQETHTGDPSDQKKDRRERKKEKKKERKKKNAQKEVPLAGSLSSLVGMKVSKIETIPEMVSVPCASVTDSDYDSQGKVSLTSLNSDGIENEVVFDGLYSMDDIKSPELGSPVNKTSVLKATGRPPFVSQKPIILKPRDTVCPSPNSISEVVKESITKLLHIRRQKETLDTRCLPKAESVVSNTIVNSPSKISAIKNSAIVFPNEVSPKVVSIPDIPKSYINKRNLVSKEEPVLSSASTNEPTKLLLQNSRSSCVAQSINECAGLNNDTVSTGIPQYKSAITNILHNKNNSPNTSIEKRKTVNVYPQASNTPPMNTEVPSQSFRDFLKELQKTINAGAGVDDSEKVSNHMRVIPIKNELKPDNRLVSIPSNQAKPEPSIPSQCAKQVVQQKKVDTLNTFSRLSYLHKNKITEKTKQAIWYDPKEHAHSKDTKDNKHTKMKYHQTKNEPVMSRVGTAPSPVSAHKVIRKSDNSGLVVAMEHPILSDILQTQLQQVDAAKNTPQKRVVPPATSHTEKDQENMLLLLRQQNNINSFQLQLKKTQRKVPQEAPIPITDNTTPIRCNNVPKQVAANLNKILPSNLLDTVSRPRINIPNNAQNINVNALERTQCTIKAVPKVIKVDSQQNKLKDVTKPLPKKTTKTDTKTDWEKVHSLPSNMTVLKYVVPDVTKELSTTTLASPDTPSEVNAPNNSQNSVNLNTVEPLQAKSKPVCKVTKSDTHQKIHKSKDLNKSHKPTTKTATKGDWESVMNAILAQKTPSRGPNALDLALKKDSIDRPFGESSLRKQRIHRSSGELNSKTAKQTKVTTTAPELYNNLPNAQILDKSKMSNHRRNSHSKIAPENHKAPVTPDPIHSSKKTNHSHTQKKQTQTEFSKKLSVAPKKQFISMPKEEDPFISGIQNSDYDLLEELMDDDLRQEIGELSSDDERYAEKFDTHKIYKDYPNLKSDSVVKAYNTALEERNNSPETKYIQQISHETLKNTAQSTSTKFINPLIGNTVATGTSVKSPKCQTDAESLNTSTIETRPLTVIQNLPSNIVLTPKSDTKQYFTTACNVALNQSNLQPNMYVAPVPQQPSLQNVVIIGSDLMYDPFTTVQTPICAASSVPQNAYVAINGTNVALYHTTEYSTQVNPLIIENPVIPTNTVPSPAVDVSPMPNVVDSLPSDNATVVVPILYETDIEGQNQLNNITTVVKPTTKEDSPEDLTPKAENSIALDINSNKNSERKFLSQVQVKQKVRKSRTSLKMTAIDDKEVKKYVSDEERIKMKRLAIINRQINHRCVVETIPLSYTPLHAKTTKAKRTQATKMKTKQNVSDVNKSNDASTSNGLTNDDNQIEETPSLTSVDGNENSKENKDESHHHRRLLLRSSNKLKCKDSISNEIAIQQVAMTTTIQQENPTHAVESQGKLEYNRQKTAREPSKTISEKKSVQEQHMHNKNTNECHPSPCGMLEQQNEVMRDPAHLNTDLFDVQRVILRNKIPKVIISKKLPKIPLVPISNNGDPKVNSKPEFESQIVQNDVDTDLTTLPIHYNEPRNDSNNYKEIKALPDYPLSDKQKTNIQEAESEINDSELPEKQCQTTQVEHETTENNIEVEAVLTNEQMESCLPYCNKKEFNVITPVEAPHHLSVSEIDEAKEINYLNSLEEALKSKSDGVAVPTDLINNGNDEITSCKEVNNPVINPDFEKVVDNQDKLAEGDLINNIFDSQPAEGDGLEAILTEAHFDTVVETQFRPARSVVNGQILSPNEIQEGRLQASNATVVTADQAVEQPEQANIPQSFKESIIIEHINDSGDDLSKKCVRIKLPTGRVFKATVHSGMPVNFDSLFADPAIKSTLMSSLTDRKKYTMNIKQVTTADKQNPAIILGTQFQDVNIQPTVTQFQDVDIHPTLYSDVIETVSLLSDDEIDDPEQSFKTEHGCFKISKIDKDIFVKHQNKLDQKCTVKLVRDAFKQNKDVTKTIPGDLESDSNVSRSATRSSMKKSHMRRLTNHTSIQAPIATKMTTADTQVPSTKVVSAVVTKIAQHKANIPQVQDIIELDDSSNDSIEIIDCDSELKDLSKVSEAVVPKDKITEPEDQIVQDVSDSSILVKATVEEPSQSNLSSSCSVNSTKRAEDKLLISGQDCYVKLTKCDDLIKKFEQISNKKCVIELLRYNETMQNQDDAKVAETSMDENLVTRCTDERVPASPVAKSLSRSSSFSILDDFSIFDVNTSGSGENDRERSSSPVIDVFETIAAFQNVQEKKYTERDITDGIIQYMEDRDIVYHVDCESEWNLTKRNLNLQVRTRVSKDNTARVNCESEWCFTKHDLHSCTKLLVSKNVFTKICSKMEDIRTLTYKVRDANGVICKPNQVEAALISEERDEDLSDEIKLESTTILKNEVISESDADGVQSLSEICVPRLLTAVTTFFQDNPDIVLQLKPKSKRKCTSHECNPVARKVSRIKIRHATRIDRKIKTDDNVNVDIVNSDTRAAKIDLIDECLTSSKGNASEDLDKLPVSEDIANVEKRESMRPNMNETIEINTHNDRSDMDTCLPSLTTLDAEVYRTENINTDFFDKTQATVGLEGHKSICKTSDDRRQTLSEEIDIGNRICKSEASDIYPTAKIQAPCGKHDLFVSPIDTLKAIPVSVVPDKLTQGPDCEILKDDKIMYEFSYTETETLNKESTKIHLEICEPLQNTDHTYLSYRKGLIGDSEMHSNEEYLKPNIIEVDDDIADDLKCKTVPYCEHVEFEHEVEVVNCSVSSDDSISILNHIAEEDGTEDDNETRKLSKKIHDENNSLENVALNLNKFTDKASDTVLQLNTSKTDVTGALKDTQWNNVDVRKNDMGVLVDNISKTIDNKLTHPENSEEALTTSKKVLKINNGEPVVRTSKLEPTVENIKNCMNKEVPIETNIERKDNGEEPGKIESLQQSAEVKDDIDAMETHIVKSESAKSVIQSAKATDRQQDGIDDQVSCTSHYLQLIDVNLDTTKSIDKQVTLIYKDDSGLVLKGIEYEDPEAGTCYMFPLLHKSSESSEEDNGGSDKILHTVQEFGDKENNSMYFDEQSEYRLVIPKITYSDQNTNIQLNAKDESKKKNLKRKILMTDVKIVAKKYRKGKNIDYPKFTASAIQETMYTNEYKRLVNYYSSIKFSYSQPFHKEYIDVHRMLAGWPIQGGQAINSNAEIDIDRNLFIDNYHYESLNIIKDPLTLTLAEELVAEHNVPTHSSEDNDSNFNMGFGEGSGRVIQNLESGGEISKMSAATLSDVKQSQPFLLTVKNDDCVIDTIANAQEDQLEAFRRYMTYTRLRDRVQMFFQKSSMELANDWHGKHDKAKDEENFTRFPYGLNSPDFIDPCPPEFVVQVVQVGQLPVSAAAQNPVTCDPRVTQVSDASPSQCSAENCSNDDPQSAIKTEYTELTTADLSLPLIQDYVNHNQNIQNLAMHESNLPLCDENIPIQTEIKSEVKIELMEETEERHEQNDANEPNEQEYLQDKHDVNNIDYSYESRHTNMAAELNTNMQMMFNSTEKQSMPECPQQKQPNGPAEKTDQIAHAMTAAGITPSVETMDNTRAQALVNMLSQKIREGVAAQSMTNNYPKTTSINAMTLQQALAQILPPPLNQTNVSENQQLPSNVAPQVLQFVQGKNASGNQITLVDNSQPPNATPVLHIVQNKSNNAVPTNGTPAPQSNTFGGISLIDTGLQQGGNQLLQIVNTGSQKNNAAGQLLKRVNLLANLANVQGSNEQKMLQFVCKSADGKSIQLNAPHQRSMVLRLQPIESPNVQNTAPKTVDQDASSATNGTNPPGKDTVVSQNEIKSRSVYEENYAKFIQNSSTKPTPPEKSTSLPKFNQAFGKQVYQDGSQKQNEMNNGHAHLPPVNNTENTECQPQDSSINLDHINQIGSPPLLIRKSQPATSQQQQPNLVQQIKQTIAPMNLQTMHGGVIYTRQIPVNIGGGQTINLITVPSTDLMDDNAQKQQTGDMEQSIIKIVPQNQSNTNSEVSTSEDGNAHMGVTNETTHNHQPQPVLTQMRIKLPMLSKTPQMMSGARVVRPSFFQIQRNVIGGANQPVYQQLVLTAAPPLGQQTIRLPQTPTPRPVKVPSESQSSTESQMSSSTLEQLREFDLVLEQVKERSTVQPSSSSTNTFPKLHTPSTDTTDSAPVPPTSSTQSDTSQQSLYSIGGTHNQPLNVSFGNRKTSVTTPTTSTYVRSPDSSGIVDSPTSSTHGQIPHTVTTESSAAETPPQPKPSKSSKSKSRPKSSSNPTNAVKINTVPPKTSTQKPLEDEQTTQRILYILAEYKEQVENSPDKDKPAPRRRTNLPPNPSGSKRKKSSSGSRRSGRDLSPIGGDDTCRTMGSEDSSCGTSQGDCNESCVDSHSPQDSPRKVVRKLTFEQETPAPQPRPQPQRNVIVADGQTITVARGTAGKPTTAVLMPANYILPVSMVKGGQQIAIVTNRGPKLLTVGGGEGGTTNALLLQRLIGPAGLKPVLTRPGVRQVRLPSGAIHNLQTFNFAAATNIQPPDSTATPAATPTPELIQSRTANSPWADRDDGKPERGGSSPDGSEPWNLRTSADPHNYSYEETVRADNMNRTVLDPIPDRYSPDMEAQRIFDKMFDVESKKSYIIDSHDDSPRCGYDIEASDCDDKPYHQVVHKKEGSSHRQHRLTHVSAAALRHKYAVLEHELRLQKSLSEECEDLGVDSPSASELFPEAELLFAASPAHDHAHEQAHHIHTAQSTLLSSSSGIQPDIDDQIATDHLLQQEMHDDRQDLNLGLEDVGIVTVRSDGMQATIAIDHEEFARAHPNTTFHSEPTDDTEAQPFTITGISKGRQITSTIFHANRTPGTVLMAPQTTVISQATAEPSHQVKYSDIDNMINSLPNAHNNNINLSSVLAKDDGLTRFDSILTDSREVHLSNTASAIIHTAGNATQVIRRVCYDDDKRERDSRFLMDEPEGLIAGNDAKMVAEDNSRDAIESMADVDDDRSSPERHAELFWESNSASERSESRRPLDFSSDSDKCCKSPPYDETNSTDSSGVGTHMRLDSVIKEARRVERVGSVEGSSAEDHPPLRTYPPKRMYHSPVGLERSTSGKTRAGEHSPSPGLRRRASGRGVVKRGCHCCNGSPAPPKPKKSRQKKPTMDFNTN